MELSNESLVMVQGVNCKAHGKRCDHKPILILPKMIKRGTKQAWARVKDFVAWFCTMLEPKKICACVNLALESQQNQIKSIIATGAEPPERPCKSISGTLVTSIPFGTEQFEEWIIHITMTG